MNRTNSYHEKKLLDLPIPNDDYKNKADELIRLGNTQRYHIIKKLQNTFFEKSTYIDCKDLKDDLDELINIAYKTNKFKEDILKEGNNE